MTSDNSLARLALVGVFRRAVLATTLFVSCLGTSAVARDRVVLPTLDDPVSLNPIYLQGGTFVMVSEIAFEPLYRYGSGGRWIPGLALGEPSIVDVGGRSQITVRLRRETKWSDGEPVTSGDFAYAIAQILNPKNNVPIAARVRDSIADVRTPDAQTLVIDATSTNPEALENVRGLVPLPKHLLAGFDDLNHVGYNALPVSNGPYVVASWKRGDSIRFEANPRYWRGRPAIATILVRIVPSVATEVVQMRTHELDLARIEPGLIGQIPATGFERHVSAGLSWAQVTINVTNPILHDVRVRHAIAAAIDRTKLAKVVGNGYYDADRALEPLFQWAADRAVRPLPFDEPLANRLLEESGWHRGHDGVRENGNRALEFSMVSLAGTTSILADTVAEDLRRVGFRIEQKALAAPIFYASAANGGIMYNGDFDLAVNAFQTGTDPDVSIWFSCAARAPTGLNFGRYCNPRADLDFARETSTFDRGIRRKALARAERVLIDDVAFVPLYATANPWVSPTWLHGIDPSAYGPYWNVWSWTADR